MEGRRNADLLQETRKLLNVLNDENASLKEDNQRLLEALAEANASKGRLEADMKKVNLNLMDQLHKRTTMCREMEAELKGLREEVGREGRRSTDSLTRVASLEGENSLLKERLRVLGEQCGSLSQQLVLAEEAAGRNTEQLAIVTGATRDAFEKERASLRERGEGLEATVRTLQQQLALVSSEKGSLENTFNDLHSEHLALQQAYEADMRAAGAQQRKSVATDADVAYLHGQLLDHKVEVSELFSAMRLYVQPLGDECERSGEEVQRLSLRVAGLVENFSAVKSADDNILTALYEKLQEQQRANKTLQDSRGEMARANEVLVSQTQALSLQLARYKSEIHNLTVVFTELQDGVAQSQQDIDVQCAMVSERDGQIVSLKEAVGAEQRLNTQLRLELENARSAVERQEVARQKAEVALAQERSQSLMRVGAVEHKLKDAHVALDEHSRRTSEMQSLYEEEIHDLRAQVAEHADTLSSALGRLRSGSAATHRPATRSATRDDLSSRATSLGMEKNPKGGSVNYLPPTYGVGYADVPSLAPSCGSPVEVAFRPSLLAAAHRLEGGDDGRLIEMDTD